MRLQLDTTNKTIKVESNVKLSELVETLEKILPNKEWEEFELQTNVTINTWSSPVVIDRYVPTYPTYPRYPWYCTTNKTTAEMKVNLTDSNHSFLKAGTYNIEC